MLPQATKTKYTHPFIPHKNSRMQVEEEEHLPPSAILLTPPPAVPRNLLLNSAQPSLGRLHFYKYNTKSGNKHVRWVRLGKPFRMV